MAWQDWQRSLSKFQGGGIPGKYKYLRAQKKEQEAKKGGNRLGSEWIVSRSDSLTVRLTWKVVKVLRLPAWKETANHSERRLGISNDKQSGKRLHNFRTDISVGLQQLKDGELT